ncbi:hypothetical protein ABG79_01946 [Caloramator mitchellensis]|uniref:CN hydrolase domain-containing protein n=1 Tax=Caloramator mitchellensis TaxID=908809 RepID=A0A0R3JRY3_CALMK|nr:carbon-nitrogen hydrolase family protein [Caloramator mitchellensis]KRQ86216.1 hypothetical protein ABG79_01946 [Caloramator mitchellensis]
MKIGLFLQDTTLTKKKKDKIFYETLNLARENNLDLLVFPEHFYCPEDEKLDEYAFLSHAYEENSEECDRDKIIDIFRNYAKIANCPILASRADKYNFIYALYVSPFEENIKLYGKHIATNYSVFDLADYEESVEEIFMPIDYKGYKIGVTICYDSNKPLFSRFYKAYGDIDILINLTGGHVDYKKWSIYQKARALENKCYNLCTMAYYDEEKRNKSYVFAFDGFGKKLSYKILNKRISSDYNNDMPNGLYMFEVDKKSNTFEKFKLDKAEDDEFLDSNSSINKKIDINLSKTDILKLLNNKNKIDNCLYLVKKDNHNLILLDLKEHMVEEPILIESLMYSKKLKGISNKKYIIINRWDKLDEDYYKKKLSTILKARAAENFCIVILMSDIKDECIQVGLNKNIQIVKCVAGKYGLDLSRSTGPESFWKNDVIKGIKKCWREKYEFLIDYLRDNKKQTIKIR